MSERSHARTFLDLLGQARMSSNETWLNFVQIKELLVV
jgi:hypothetical protein